MPQVTIAWQGGEPTLMGLDFNILCTGNAVNSRHPLEVYRFSRDELGARFLQFIPIVERQNDSGFQCLSSFSTGRWPPGCGAN